MTPGWALMTKAVSILVPTLNEVDSIPPLIAALDAALKGYDYEIVIVDDDSSDGTADRARALAGEYPVRVIVRKNQRGLASAVIDGLRQVESDVVGVIDADLQHPPEVMRGLLEAIDHGADLAVASRYVSGGGCEGWSLTRRLISKGAILLSHLLLPATRPVRDPMSGCFAFKRAAVDDTQLKPFGYKILLEIIMTGAPKRIVEIGYSFRCRTQGASKLSARQQVEYIKQLSSLMGRAGEWRRIVKFGLVGASGVLVNMGLLWLLTEFAGLVYLISAAIGIECAIISNFTLNDYFTFRDRRAKGGGNFVRRLGKFNLVSLGGVGINLLILWFLSGVLGVNYLVSNLCGIAVATLWNYLLNSWWTWK